MKTLIEQYNEARTQVGRKLSGLTDYNHAPMHGPIPLTLREHAFDTPHSRHWIEVCNTGGEPVVTVSSAYRGMSYNLGTSGGF